MLQVNTTLKNQRLKVQNILLFSTISQSAIALNFFPSVFLRKEPPLLGRVHVRSQGPLGVGRGLGLQRSQLDFVNSKLKTRTLFVKNDFFAVDLENRNGKK